jgi:hypothetical protein
VPLLFPFFHIAIAVLDEIGGLPRMIFFTSKMHPADATRL